MSAPRRSGNTDDGDNDDLKRALRLRLAAGGVLDQMKAQMRAEVYKCFIEPHNQESSAHPKLPPENYIINELIREYLEFNGYHHTHAVLVSETHQPQERLTRQLLADRVHVEDTPDAQQLPLLYHLIGSSSSSTPKQNRS
eukprot:m.7091 g.7091  ORF g.7091 m.7091 type:complete len:140 (+) comp5073_c0_seq1:149-568(+)